MRLDVETLYEEDNNTFEFMNLDILSDGEIDLRIMAKVPANEIKKYVPSYKYNIFLHKSDTNIGFIDIRIGYNENLYYGGHIGYEILKPYQGHNFAFKSCKLIKQVALAHKMPVLYITCSPTNIASKKTIEKLGLTFVKIEKLPQHNEMYQEGKREVCIFKWDLVKK